MPSLSRYAPYVLGILRIVAAILFIEHGTQKLFGIPERMAGMTAAPEMFTLLWWAAVLEIVGGSLILIGLLTRPVAFLLSGQMAVAYWIAHAPQNMFPALNGGDAAILFCFVFLYLVFAGPGRLRVARVGRS